MRVIINRDEVSTYLTNLRKQMEDPNYDQFFIKFSFGRADAERMLANSDSDREMVLIFGGGITT
jgi:hypothetical protein